MLCMPKPSELRSISSAQICAEQRDDVRLGSILLQKSFWGDERKFLEALMRFTGRDVRDHIVSSKIDHRPPQRHRKATRQQRGARINFREIFRVVRFSTFATISVKTGGAGNGKSLPVCPSKPTFKRE